MDNIIVKNKSKCVLEVARVSKGVQIRIIREHSCYFFNVLISHWREFKNQVKSLSVDDDMTNFNTQIDIFITQTEFVELKYPCGKNVPTYHFSKEVLLLFINRIKNGEFNSIK